ncbi:(2Fe-2S)-binding protein [Streptomyces sp. NPDC006368]|uniref:(2Fe-2S)-binding protein n=1 Tax=Streptomyces sp. NPDC006368 TaxID=3156760 RepID=UPI0033AAEA4A
MTTDEHGNERGNEHGGEQGQGWQPTPYGEYDGDATAFVQLPPDLSADGAPLAAPGHGYVPAEAWTAHDPNATAQWHFPEAPVAEPAPSQLTGQWTIPVARGDLPEESGEFTTSALTSQWASGHPPATLPGGAAAPWATPAPEHEAAQDATAPTEPAAAADADRPGAADHVDAVDHADTAGHAPRTDGAGTDPTAGSGPAAGTGTGTDATAAAPAPADPAHAHAPAPTDPAPPPPELTPEPEPVPAAVPTHVTDSDEHPHVSYVLRVNGVDRPVTEAWIGESLLYVLRERLGLAGAKDGCSQGECGACNVQVDGRLVASCLVPAATAAGSEVRTVEGLAVDGEPSDVQRALAACGAVQCGFCIPGMAMTVHDLLEGNHAPSELETRQALCGNLCRCTGYRGVLDAVREVVAERSASAAAAAEAAEEARIPHQVPHPHDGGMA